MRRFITCFPSSTLAVIASAAIISCAAANPKQIDNAGQTSGRAREAGSQTGGHVSVIAQEPKPVSNFLDTTYVPTTGRQITVSAISGSKAFQAALNQARAGDEIVLEAGATFIGSFTLPARADKGWVVIRSSMIKSLPPAGVRVGPAQAAHMPKLLAGGNNSPVIKTEAGAHHYRLVGIEMSVASNVTLMGDLVKLGDSSSSQSTLESVPHDLVIDRCYIHGRADLPLKRGVALNSARSAVIDSYISEVHVVGQDTQAIAGWNGPGPFKIVNNYLEAAGENLMFGGSATGIPDLVPTDIEIRRNHFFKPLSWRVGATSYGGTRWTVKNLFELKSARRVLIDGNIFENCWVDAQTGFAINIKTSNQNSGQAWQVTEDVTFTNNIVRHAAGGVTLLGRSQPETGNTKRIKITNNIFEDIGGTWGRNMGRLFQLLDGVDHVTIDHNTCFQTGHIIAAGGKAPNHGFVFTNNIVPHNSYGVKGDGASVGNDTINKFFPGSVFRKNVIAGGRSSLYPPDNFFPPRLDVSIDWVNGTPKLTGSDQYRNSGSDGRSAGCDVEVLKAALGPTNITSPMSGPSSKKEVGVTSCVTDRKLRGSVSGTSGDTRLSLHEGENCRII